VTDDPRLSQLTTRWTLLAQAHAADPAVAEAARSDFLPRYCAPVYRYLLGIAGDADRAEELAQEFAVRFLRGDFRHARPERGRFRDYVKVAVIHLIDEYRRRWQAAGRFVPLDSTGSAAATVPAGQAAGTLEEFWRQTLLNLAWAGLERPADEGGPLLYEVLRLKADDPERLSADIAAELARRHGRPFTTANVRQMLHRAREKFRELLWREAAESIPSDDPAAVEAELAELGLLAYFGSGGPGRPDAINA